MDKRDLTSITDLSVEDISTIYGHAARLKAAQKAGQPHRELDGRVLSMIFEKPSLRTRMTFEVGIYQLGGLGVSQVSAEVGVGKRESVYDIAKNLERWVDLVMIRTFQQTVVDEMARHCAKPVINALTDWEHPCQALTDLFTLSEHKGRLEGVNLTYIGDGNNVCHSLLLLCPLLGVNITVGGPGGEYAPDPAIVAKATQCAANSGSRVVVTDDPVEAVGQADAIYADVWASMGQESEQNARKRIFIPYQVNAALVAHAPAGALIMHDLPAHRGEEITDEVIDSPQSIVFDQAENRLHVQKGIMVFLYKG